MTNSNSEPKVLEEQDMTPEQVQKHNSYIKIKRAQCNLCLKEFQDGKFLNKHMVFCKKTIANNTQNINSNLS
jgi:hypothetical protein